MRRIVGLTHEDTELEQYTTFMSADILAGRIAKDTDPVTTSKIGQATNLFTTMWLIVQQVRMCIFIVFTNGTTRYAQ